MTREEFLRELEAIRDQFKWMPFRIYKPIDAESINYMIRGVKDSHYFCPITAVCYTKTGKIHNGMNWNAAAKELGMDLKDAALIVYAADHNDPDIRRAVGLS